MINLKLNDKASNIHFLKVKDILQSRITNILKSGIKINGISTLPSVKLSTYLNSLLNDEELNRLLTARPEAIEGIISEIDENNPDFIDSVSTSNYILYNIFVSNCYNLSNKFSKHEFISNIHLDTCPYCNRSYIYYISKNQGIKPQIDHFFPKSKYPFLAMSFYNLIPSCQTCNGFGAKEEKDPLEEELINPYLLDSSAFSFSYEPVSAKIISSHLDKNSIKVKIVKNVPGHLNVFRLVELYEQHADHVVELIVKSKIKYSETYRHYLKTFEESGLRFSENEIDRMILGNYATDDEIHKRPLAKLYQDIGKELGLIK